MGECLCAWMLVKAEKSDSELHLSEDEVLAQVCIGAPNTRRCHAHVRLSLDESPHSGWL